VDLFQQNKNQRDVNEGLELYHTLSHSVCGHLISSKKMNLIAVSAEKKERQKIYHLCNTVSAFITHISIILHNSKCQHILLISWYVLNVEDFNTHT